MSEYTPTTGVVRGAYVEDQIGYAMPYHIPESEHEERFDRWLAEVERAAAQKAWGEGFQACAEWWEIHHWQHTEAFEGNPYRKEQP